MRYMRWLGLVAIIMLALLPEMTMAASGSGGLQALSVTTGADGKQTYSLSIQILLAMTFLTVLPGLLLSMTAFTRILIVLVILRQAMGMPQTPTNQILIGMSLFLTFFVMSPVLKQVNEQALQPLLSEKINFNQAIEKAEQPLRGFMLKQTRTSDIDFFAELSGQKKVVAEEDVSFLILMPAFVTSELKTAFQIGFMLFLPFLIIDLVVASVLMAMGMMMLSPLIVSLPFKIMLFVLIDGWTLVMGTLATSFGV